MRSDKKIHEDLEMRLLLEGVFQISGYDFRDYAVSSMKRRVLKCVQDEKVKTISALQELILHDTAAMERFVSSISINVTSMFRDPEFYRFFRSDIAPALKTYPFIRLWHAGCSSGEEVYSMAILLSEEGIYERAKIYTTDINEAVIGQAREGVYPLEKMKDNTRNYLETGGLGTFSDYYTAKYDRAIFNTALKKNIVWAVHNLVTDASFNEFHVILCRNVMIYFNQSLQNRVHDLLYNSLIMRGFLCLGAKESIRFTAHEKDYETVDERMKIYRKKG